MQVESEIQRHRTRRTLSEVMRKLEEALRLSRTKEEAASRPPFGAVGDALHDRSKA
jgi:hypothetical protein